MYAESGKQEPNEYKNKKRAKRSEKKTTHQLKMKIVLFIAVRLTTTTTTTIHVRACCYPVCHCCLPLFSTNPFVIHAILPIHSSFLKLFFSFFSWPRALLLAVYIIFCLHLLGIVVAFACVWRCFMRIISYLFAWYCCWFIVYAQQQFQFYRY